MPIERFLTHRVSIVRHTDTLSEDDYGQPIRTTDTLASLVPAAIMPKSDRELANVSEAGAALSDHKIYMLPRDITTADRIVHEAGVCPMVVDLPDGVYEITGVPSASGAGHHLEIDAHRIDGVASSGVPAVVGGSGS